MKEWFERFKTWVRYEPVRAAETVRATLISLTVLSPFVGAQDEITAVGAFITGLFSLYASKLTRDRVWPDQRVKDDFEEKERKEVPDTARV